LEQLAAARIPVRVGPEEVEAALKSHADVFDAVLALREILTTRAWDQPRFHTRALVT
jgi:kynureninase